MQLSASAGLYLCVLVLKEQTHRFSNTLEILLDSDLLPTLLLHVNLQTNKLLASIAQLVQLARKAGSTVPEQYVDLVAQCRDSFVQRMSLFYTFQATLVMPPSLTSCIFCHQHAVFNVGVEKHE